MVPTLVFDYDGSLASLGGDEVQQKLFCFPPIRIYKGLEQTRMIIRQLIKPIKSIMTHPLFENASIESEGFELSPKSKEMNLNCIVFDTITALGLQERGQLKHSKKLDTLDQRSWGVYGDALNSFIYNMCSLPIKIIFNAHIDRDKDVDGETIEFPALKGSSKTEVLKWFDIVLFTRVSRDPKTDETIFQWQTKPQEGRLAKDRLNVLQEIMPQDFSTVFAKYEEAGIHNPKILVLGDSGTGKSRALATINQQAIKTKAAHIAA
jgi:hypothetical protein